MSKKEKYSKSDDEDDTFYYRYSSAPPPAPPSSSVTSKSSHVGSSGGGSGGLAPSKSTVYSLIPEVDEENLRGWLKFPVCARLSVKIIGSPIYVKGNVTWKILALASGMSS